jgi:hypothetical protein
MAQELRMFASLFRNKPASTIRRGSSRTRLGIENLEDRTVPSTLLSNLGFAGDGGLGRPGDGVELFGTRRAGEEVPALCGATEGIELFGGKPGGVDMDTVAVGKSASGLGRAGDGVDLFGTRRAGEEVPALCGITDGVELFGGAGGGVDMDTVGTGEETPQRAGVSILAAADAALAQLSMFSGSLDADGGDGSFEAFAL